MFIGIGIRAGARVSLHAFSPQELSPALWLKADAGTFQTVGGSAATADADPVGQWQDQSGNGRHVSQGTAANRPILKLSQQNGLPSIQFDGVNDRLDCAAGVSIIDTRVPHTVYVVMKANAAARRLLCGNANGAGDAGFMVDLARSATEDFTFRWHDATNVMVADSDITAFAMWGAICGATSQVLRKNAAQVDSDTVTLSSLTYAVEPFTVGDGTDSTLVPFSGDILELLLFTSALSTTDRDNLETYLNSRWALY